MFTKVTLPYTESLHRIVHSDMWPEVKKYLEAELQATMDKMLNTADATELHVLRGQAAFLKGFLKQTTETRHVLDRFGKV